MLTIILLCLLYIVSFYAVWKYLYIAYSKEGKWEYTSLSSPDLLITVLPVINTAGILLWCTSPKRDKKTTFLSKFFNIKKIILFILFMSLFSCKKDVKIDDIKLVEETYKTQEDKCWVCDIKLGYNFYFHKTYCGFSSEPHFTDQHGNPLQSTCKIKGED